MNQDKTSRLEQALHTLKQNYRHPSDFEDTLARRIQESAPSRETQPLVKTPKLTSSWKWALVAAACLSIVIIKPWSIAGKQQTDQTWRLSATIQEISFDSPDPFNTVPSQFKKGQIILPGQSLRTNKGETLTLSLSDGSLITLFEQSHIHLDSHVPRTLTLLNGQMNAHIKHLGDAPEAHYQTAETQVVVLGTHFTLERHRTHTYLNLIEGHVRMHHSRDESIELHAGQQAKATPDTLTRQTTVNL